MTFYSIIFFTLISNDKNNQFSLKVSTRYLHCSNSSFFIGANAEYEDRMYHIIKCVIVVKINHSL